MFEKSFLFDIIQSFGGHPVYEYLYFYYFTRNFFPNDCHRLSVILSIVANRSCFSEQ